MPTKSSIRKSANSIGLLIQRSVFSPISTPSSILFSSCFIGSPLANQLKGIAIPHRRYAFSSSYQKKNLLIQVIHVAACH